MQQNVLTMKVLEELLYIEFAIYFIMKWGRSHTCTADVL
jgi:hypothetical protein